MSYIQQHSFLKGPAAAPDKDEESYHRFQQARAREDAEEDERTRRQLQEARERKYASEWQAFKAFQIAEAARLLREKAEVKAEAERIAAEAENARLRAAELTRQEQADAVELAKSMFEDAFTRDHYRRPDKQLIDIGLRLKVGSQPDYPNPLLPYWRDARYKGKVEWVNMAFTVPFPDDPNRRSTDGWPLPDKADEDAKRILNTEWDKWLGYCRRFADRFGEGGPPSEKEERIAELECKNASLQAALDEANAKIEKSRQAFASTFA
jgi:hypothetical protein